MAAKSTKKPAAKKAPAKKATAKKPAAKKATAKKAAAKKATAKKPVAKKAAKRATAHKATANKAPPRRPAAKKASTVTDPAAVKKRIDEYIAGCADWRGGLLADIRRMIHEVDPDIIEDWKWMGTPCWSHDGMVAIANAHKDKVKITFHHGAQLKDPNQLFNNGLGGKWRAIDLKEGDKLDPAGFKALLREAIAYNTSHAVPKSKGSRAALLR